jgi:hypothetical protein
MPKEPDRCDAKGFGAPDAVGACEPDLKHPVPATLKDVRHSSKMSLQWIAMLLLLLRAAKMITAASRTLVAFFVGSIS